MAPTAFEFGYFRATWPGSRPGRCTGSALVVVMWCLVLLGLVVVSTLHTTRLETHIVKNQGDLIQARYLALAGVEKAKALVYQESQRRRESGRDARSTLHDNPAEFQNVKLGRGSFRVIRHGSNASGARVYGLTDEESRLNMNVASAEQLYKVRGLAIPIAAAVVDWRDDDHKLTSEGAERDYYDSLDPPHRIRNGPLETLQEALMIRGVTPNLLLGEDTNYNRVLDPNENDGAESPPGDDRDGVLDRGWADTLTVHSEVDNASAWGKARVDIQQASAESLAEVDGISTDLAAKIVAYRGQNSLETIADLLDVKQVTNTQNTQNTQSGGGNAPTASRAYRESTAATTENQESGSEITSSGSDQNQGAGGENLISLDLLKRIADHVTTGTGRTIPGAVNINTASREAIACLPGITEDLSWALLSFRQQKGYISSVVELLDAPGVTREIFKQLVPGVTVRSETFRVVAEGWVPSSGARRRIEVVFRVGDYDVDTLYYREEL